MSLSFEVNWGTNGAIAALRGRRRRRACWCVGDNIVWKIQVSCEHMSRGCGTVRAPHHLKSIAQHFRHLLMLLRPKTRLAPLLLLLDACHMGICTLRNDCGVESVHALVSEPLECTAEGAGILCVISGAQCSGGWERAVGGPDRTFSVHRACRICVRVAEHVC